MTARDALLISNVAFLTLVALAFVASVVVFFLNRASERAKDRELAAYQTAAELRIHSARADAAAALERAISRDADSVQARERTAMFVREAAALHAQTMAARVLPLPPPRAAIGHSGERTVNRTLSSEQRARMISVLIAHPGQITVINDAGPEPERYAADLRVIFNVSGWKVESGIVIEPRIPLAPLSLVLGTSEQDMAVRKAFEGAGVAVPDRPRSPMDRPTTIYVGS
ncbi:MAG: hypothetical protein JWO83_1578 [Caulobacteraceae bacterium]|nr:hypothetical protein [Caulobacteraceae bacterium]